MLKNKAGVSLPPVAEIPVLIPDTALAAIKGDETEPYEIIEAIPFPSEGVGGIYTGKYFESLLSQMQTRPLGGSKTGHDNEKDDFFTIGGKIEHTNEHKGICYLRIMVPTEGYETTNSGFIRSCKTGNQEFSIVANVEPLRGNDGKVYFVKDIGKARNDAVPEGAMEQTVSNTKKEHNEVDKAEIIAAVKAAIANNTLTLEELAQAVSMENKLRTRNDDELQAAAKEIVKLVELEPGATAQEIKAEVETLVQEVAETAEALIEAEAEELANGKKLKNADGTERDNPVYLYAKKELSGKRGKTLKNAVEKLKSDQIMLDLRSKQADPRAAVPQTYGNAKLREV
jgi:hypothetical protein